jgi:hypothetical protein
MQAAGNATEADMHENRILVLPRTRRRQSDGLKDEVYRHMFRLEAHCRGAERDLAVALLRAWMTEHQSAKERLWLMKICPICLAMIEAVEEAGNTEQCCIQ